MNISSGEEKEGKREREKEEGREGGMKRKKRVVTENNKEKFV